MESCNMLREMLLNLARERQNPTARFISFYNAGFKICPKGADHGPICNAKSRRFMISRMDWKAGGFDWNGFSTNTSAARIPHYKVYSHPHNRRERISNPRASWARGRAALIHPRRCPFHHPPTRPATDDFPRHRRRNGEEERNQIPIHLSRAAPKNADRPAHDSSVSPELKLGRNFLIIRLLFFSATLPAAESWV